VRVIDRHEFNVGITAMGTGTEIVRCDDEELAGGGYGSGGRDDECHTEPGP
jgi:hypothetical protein